MTTTYITTPMPDGTKIGTQTNSDGTIFEGVALNVGSPSAPAFVGPGVPMPVSDLALADILAKIIAAPATAAGQVAAQATIDAILAKLIAAPATEATVTAIDGLLSSYSITQTVVTVTVTSQALIAANSARKYLAWMTVGTQDVTIVPGVIAAVVGAGMVYQGSGVNKQGASQEFADKVPTSAFQVIAAAVGSKIVVWEGA